MLSKQDIFIDLGGEDSPFTGIVEEIYGCNSYLQDLKYPKGIHGKTIGGSASILTFPDESVSAMTLHCAIDNFEGNVDSEVIKEDLRVLKTGGRLIIIPLSLHHYPIYYYNPRNTWKGFQFDKDAYRVYQNNHPTRLIWIYSL